MDYNNNNFNVDNYNFHSSIVISIYTYSFMMRKITINIIINSIKRTEYEYIFSYK